MYRTIQDERGLVGDGFDFLRLVHLPDAIWQRFVAGDYRPEETEILEDHLLVCPNCQKQFATAKAPANSVR